MFSSRFILLSCVWPECIWFCLKRLIFCVIHFKKTPRLVNTDRKKSWCLMRLLFFLFLKKGLFYFIFTSSTARVFFVCFFVPSIKLRSMIIVPKEIFHHLILNHIYLNSTTAFHVQLLVLHFVQTFTIVILWIFLKLTPRCHRAANCPQIGLHQCSASNTHRARSPNILIYLPHLLKMYLIICQIWFCLNSSVKELRVYEGISALDKLRFRPAV